MASRLSFVLGLFLLTGCTRTLQQWDPQRGMVKTQESYPQYTALRTKKNIYLSLSDQDRFRCYFIRHHSWPLSEQGFVAESDTNYNLVKELRYRGFSDLSFDSRGPDTLRIQFVFQTLGYLRYDMERTATIDNLGNTFTGSFLFVADPVTGISFRQEMNRHGHKWYWPFEWRPFSPPTHGPARIR